MARTTTPKNSLPPENCNNSICYAHFLELEETIIKLRQDLEKEKAEKRFYAEEMTKLMRHNNK
jgi:hypothetical protein